MLSVKGKCLSVGSILPDGGRLPSKHLDGTEGSQADRRRTQVPAGPTGRRRPGCSNKGRVGKERFQDPGSNPGEPRGAGQRLGGEVSTKQNPRFLLRLTERRDQCLGGTAVHRHGIRKGLCFEGRLGRMGQSQIPGRAKITHQLFIHCKPPEGMKLRNPL